MKKLSLVLVLVACGTAPSGPGGTGGSGGSGGSGGGGGSGGAGNYQCCLNDTGYRCPDKASFDKCAGFDLEACINGCSFSDFMCMQRCNEQAANATHDPSSCNRDSTVSCQTSGSCIASTRQCDIDADCSSDQHCTQGSCWPDQAGCKCDIDADCGVENHCTQGTCYADRSGSPCDIDADCGVNGACVNGECQ